MVSWTKCWLDGKTNSLPCWYLWISPRFHSVCDPVVCTKTTCRAILNPMQMDYRAELLKIYFFFSEKFFPPQYAATETATSERYKPVKLITGFRTVEYASVNKVLLFVVDTCMDEEHTNIKFGIPLVQFRRSIASCSLPTSEIWPWIYWESCIASHGQPIREKLILRSTEGAALPISVGFVDLNAGAWIMMFRGGPCSGTRSGKCMVWFFFRSYHDLEYYRNS